MINKDSLIIKYTSNLGMGLGLNVAPEKKGRIWNTVSYLCDWTISIMEPHTHYMCVFSCSVLSYSSQSYGL